MEILTVRQSEDNKVIRIEGTQHSLSLLHRLIDEALRFYPDSKEQRCIVRVINPVNMVEIVVECR